MFALRASTAYLIFCAHQKGVAVKNARGRSSARGAENEVWLPYTSSRKVLENIPEMIFFMKEHLFRNLYEVSSDFETSC